MAAWMVYALVVSTLFGLGAVLLERGFRLARLQGRWIWAGAMVGTLVLPVVARSTPAEPAPAAPMFAVAVEATTRSPCSSRSRRPQPSFWRPSASTA